MIFFLRIIIFSFFIILGFRFSVRSIKGRAITSVIYGCELLYYTFLCRVHLTVDVAASDYGHAITTQRSVGENIWQLLKSIFGMDSSGHLAGVYWQAFILNSYLFIPLGYLVLLWLLCGDSTDFGSPLGRETRDVITDGDPSRVNAAESLTTEKRIKTTALRSLVICVATSLLIEITQEISGLGMFDINDLIANSIGGGVAIFITLVWMRKHPCVAE